MDKILAILTEDAAFGHTLAEYILNSHVLKYRVISFYDIPDYLQFKDSGHIHVLLLGEELKASFIKDDEDAVFILTEENKAGENTIYKYQSLEITVKELAYMLYGAGEKSEPGRRFGIKAVMGGKGGSGTTTFALTLAGVLGLERNVLFISLDPFACMPADMEASDGDLGELIYCLKAGKEGYIPEVIRHGRSFDYLYGVLTFEDLNAFGKAEMRSFLSGLSRDGRYNLVVFDMGNMPPCAGVVLEKSETVYLVGEDGESAEEQLKRLLQEGTEKIKKVQMPLVAHLQKGTETYSEIESSELWEFTKKLLSGEETKLVDNEGSFELALKESVPYEVEKAKTPWKQFLGKLGMDM
ncbi:MAG: hypothetical protein ACI39R_09055 [Lachnospiraceae bacterium]